MDSDSEEEPLKRPVANSQKQCDFQSREQQQEELEKVRKELGRRTFDDHITFLWQLDATLVTDF